jgi:small conductance mechanosensitive channel
VRQHYNLSLMDGTRLPVGPLQAGPLTPNGTGANVTDTFMEPKAGPVAEFLRQLGVPEPKILGAAITFVIALVVFYILG